MSKLFCEYDHENPKTEIADHKCDICGKLLCKICGYIDYESGLEFCNECWIEKEEDAGEEAYPEIKHALEHEDNPDKEDEEE